MTKKEKQLIKQAIKLIHEDDYFQGMNILAKLIGAEPMDFGKIKNVNLADIIKEPSKIKKDDN